MVYHFCWEEVLLRNISIEPHMMSRGLSSSAQLVTAAADCDEKYLMIEEEICPAGLQISPVTRHILTMVAVTANSKNDSLNSFTRFQMTT